MRYGRIMTRNQCIAGLFCRCLLAAIFLYAGIPKLFAIAAFAEVVDAYGIVPQPFVLPIAISLVLAELAAAVGLLVNSIAALHAVAVLLVVFIVALSYGIAMGLNIDCGCFSQEDPEYKAFSGLHSALLRDVLLLALVFYLYLQSGYGTLLKKGYEKMKKLKMLSIVTAVCLSFCSFADSGFAFGKKKFVEEVEKETAAVKLLREVQRGDYKIITTAELQGVIKNEHDYLIIDTMPFKASYVKNHIPTAKQFLFPIAEMDEWDSAETDNKTAAEFASLLGPDKNKKIIVYCGFVKCTRSHNGAMWARKLGYTDVYRHPGGIYAWKGAGYQVVSGQ